MEGGAYGARVPCQGGYLGESNRGVLRVTQPGMWGEDRGGMLSSLGGGMGCGAPEVESRGAEFPGGKEWDAEFLEGEERDAELPGAGPGGPGGGSTWLISRRQFNIYEVFLFESQVFGSSYKELRHPAITW